MDAHKVGEKGGTPGEVMRRINVVYFLSRGGRTDHPHLFRVNHLNRAGVRLRDVKRWLSELRGKDMPDNYSWSYKRKYKAGYVWQDLKDDDLITPISDNEFVLKGCDIRGTPPPPYVQAPTKTPSLGEKKEQKETPCNNDHQDRPVEVVLTQDSDENSPKTPPPADQDSPAGGDSARRPFKVDEEPRGVREQAQHQQQEVVIKIEVARSQEQEHPHEQKQQQQQQKEEEEETATEKAVASEERRRQGAVRSHTVGQQQARRMRVARALHSMLTCGAADADDAALRPVARRQGRGAAEAAGGDDWAGPTPTCPGMDGCGLRVSRTARSRRGGKEKQGKRDGRERDAHNKPATLPRCSECGKEFKPQELHAHMQSCRGFRERMRRSTSARASVDRRRNSTAGHRGKSGHRSPERPSSASAVFLLTES